MNGPVLNPTKFRDIWINDMVVDAHPLYHQHLISCSLYWSQHWFNSDTQELTLTESNINSYDINKTSVVWIAPHCNNYGIATLTVYFEKSLYACS